MRHRAFLALVPGVLVAAAWACSSTPASAPADAGVDGSAGNDTGGGDVLPQPDIGPPLDAASNACTLADGSDPVALCTQEHVLAAELANAYVTGQGVAPGWSAAAPFTPVAGHAWQDDLGLAGALGAYLCSAELYGNNHSTAPFTAKLTDLADRLVGELQPPPAGYDGETYFRLRWAQAAYFYIDDPHGATLAAIADAYGAGLASQAYAVQAGGDGGSPGGMVIGTKNADGSVTYSPAQAAMAAAALLDLAAMQEGTPDAGPTASWLGIAQQVLAYVLARGRDPVTGLFYQSLTTSGDPGHDTIGAGTPTGDTMLTESNAWVILALARAQDLLAAYQANPVFDAGASDGGLPPLPIYWNAANAVAAALTAAGLFDGTTSPPPPPATPPVGAYIEGLVLSGSQLLSNKTTIGNSVLLGGLHRVAASNGSPESYQLGEIRSALLQSTPANSSLMSVVTDDPSGTQQAYLRASSRSFGYAVAFTAGAEGMGQGEEPGARNYRSDAVHAMVEGMTQLWHGASHAGSCAP